MTAQQDAPTPGEPTEPVPNGNPPAPPSSGITPPAGNTANVPARSGTVPPAEPGKPAPPSGGGRAGRFGRWVGSVALMIVALLLSITTIAAVFVRNQVLNTDRYVNNIGPVAADPLVQDAISTRVSNEILAQLNLKSYADQASAWLQKQGAPPAVNQLVGPAVSAAEGFVRSTVDKFVHSDRFQAVWVAANRTAHQALVSVVTGESVNGVVATKGNAVTVDLGPLIANVKAQLVADGFGLASKIPNVSATFTVFDSPKIGKVQSLVRLLNTAATWLPWVTLVVILAAIFAAPSWRRGLLVTGLVLAIGLLVFRGLVRVLVENYLSDLPPTVQNPQAIQRVFTIFLRNVRTAISFFALLFFLGSVFAFLFGPSRPSRWIRTVIDIRLDYLGHALGRSGVPLGPVPATVDKYRRIAAPLFIAIAIVFIVFFPGIPTLLWSVFGVLVALAIVEILARASRPPTVARAPAPVPA